MEGSGWEKSRVMPGGARTAGAAAARGRIAAGQLLATLSSTCFPFFPGKISAFRSSAEPEISLLLHIKGNPSYNRVSVVEAIKSKQSLMQQRGGHAALQRQQPAVRQGTGFTLLLRLDVKTRQDSLGERRDRPE